MAVWGTPDDCLERISYVDSIHPEQLMLNIASGSLAQEKILKSMRLCAEAVLPALRVGLRRPSHSSKKRPTVFDNHCLG